MHRRNKPFPKHPPMSAQGVIALGFAAIIALVTDRKSVV